MEENILAVLEPVIRTFQNVQPYLTTLSPSQYNYYKESKMPPAQTIMQKTGKPWGEILDFLGMKKPLDRDTLSRLSSALHLLEKKIIKVLDLGWDEKSFTVTKHKRMRPDSFCLERAYLQNNQLLVLDVKLSICSYLITVYKYLPIFVKPAVPRQLTFFPSWLPENALNEEPRCLAYDGQLGLFLEHNILYICYLVGKPQDDLLPGSEIAFGKVSPEKKKKIPLNMEVRFIDFFQLPKVYSKIGGIEYQEELIKPVLQMADRIKEVVLSLPENAGEISREIYRRVKLGMF